MLKFLTGLVAHALAALSLTAQFAVPMNRYDRFPTGANTQETALNSTNVNAARFGKLYSYYVDGAVYAQPLYVPARQQACNSNSGNAVSQAPGSEQPEISGLNATKTRLTSPRLQIGQSC
jgi:hypothetical protein